MPWVIERDGKFIGRAGMVPTKELALRYYDKAKAEKAAEPGDALVADTMRRGIDRPCSLHKGPAGNCTPWNCTCY